MYYTFCLNQDAQDFLIYRILFDEVQEIYHPQ